MQYSSPVHVLNSEEYARHEHLYMVLAQLFSLFDHLSQVHWLQSHHDVEVIEIFWVLGLNYGQDLADLLMLLTGIVTKGCCSWRKIVSSLKARSVNTL